MRLDRDSLAQPGRDDLRSLHRFPLEYGEQFLVVHCRGRHISFEHDRRSCYQLPFGSEVRNPVQARVAFFVFEPGNLKRVVAFQQAIGVIVNCLAGASEQSGGCVLLAEDEVRVGLAALQSDPHGNLTKRAAGQ